MMHSTQEISSLLMPGCCSCTDEKQDMLMMLSMQEMDGLRNPHIDKFLPPKRKEHTSGRRQLSFVFDPIVDLNLPDKDQ